MRVILLGPPGSGKGTQGDLIEKRYNFPKISTGDLLRQAVLEGTPLGKKAASQMNRGELVSDSIVEEIVKERISYADCFEGYVLDGFPRTISQAKSLERMDGSRPEIVIEIVMDAQTLVDRLHSRRICSQCGAIYNLEVRRPKKDGVCDICQGSLIQREDDRPEVIKERLRVYQKKTAPLRDYYLRKNVYQRLDGRAQMNTLFGEISLILDTKLAKFKEKQL